MALTACGGSKKQETSAGREQTDASAETMKEDDTASMDSSKEGGIHIPSVQLKDFEFEYEDMELFGEKTQGYDKLQLEALIDSWLESGNCPAREIHSVDMLTPDPFIDGSASQSPAGPLRVQFVAMQEQTDHRVILVSLDTRIPSGDKYECYYLILDTVTLKGELYRVEKMLIEEYDRYEYEVYGESIRDGDLVADMEVDLTKEVADYEEVVKPKYSKHEAYEKAMALAGEFGDLATANEKIEVLSYEGNAGDEGIRIEVRWNAPEWGENPDNEDFRPRRITMNINLCSGICEQETSAMNHRENALIRHQRINLF